MSRDRPEILRQALHALKASCSDKHNIVISDNSSSPEISNRIHSICVAYNCLFIENRKVGISQYCHNILTGLDFSFLTILHDDDIVMPGFVPGRFGELVPVGDVDALAAGIRRAVRRPWDREALQRRALDFSIPRQAQAYLDLFNRL